MKLIIAIVRPFTVEKIINAFEDIEGFPGMTVIDSEGFGQRLKNTTTDVLDPLKPNKQLEIVTNEELVEPIISAIKEQAHTGRKGDGFIIVLNIEDLTLI